MALPKSKRSVAWETFAVVLQSNPVLRREVKTWRLWSGDPKDKEEPSTGQLPWIRITPHSGPMGFATNMNHRADFLLDVEIAMEGTNSTKIMDFQEAIERAVYPADPADADRVARLLKDAGIVVVEFLEASWDVKNSGGYVLQGKGKIRLNYFTRDRNIK